MAAVNDSMLDEIFSKVHLTPVMYQDPNFKIPVQEEEEFHDARYDITPTSDDENAALRHLDDFLLQQNSNSGSLTGSEHHEEDRIEKRTNSTSSSTLKSPRTSRTGTAVGSTVHGDHSSAWVEESYDHFDQARLPGGFPRVQEESRNRSRTIDSQASMAESRFGGFDLFDDSGNPQGDTINLHHNEVAYPRPIQLPQSQAQKPVPKVNPEPLMVDKKILDDYHRRLAETKVKEQALHDEILRTQSHVLGSEISLRQAAQNARQQLKELEMSPLAKFRQHPPAPQELPMWSKTNGHSKAKNNSSPGSGSDVPWKYEFNSIKRQPSVDIYEESVPISLILSEQLDHAELLEVNPSFRYFIPQHEKVQHSKNIEKIYFGGHQNPTSDDKSVLLFGTQGSGKTAFVNSVANYLYDVKKEQDVRLCVNYEKDGTPTKGIRVYVFNNTIYPYRITIIDTPGVPNQKGYTKTSSLIRDWFEMELATSKSLRIDAISIVLRHDEDELGWPLINELAAVKRLLKDDLRTNVLPITTFGEVLPQPLALRSLVFANIPFVSYYKVNNAGYMQRPPNEKPLTHNMGYKHTVAELERFFTDLHELVVPLLAVRNHQ